MKYIYQVLDYMAWFWFMEWLILVYIIDRIIHGCLEIWNLASCVHIRYLTRSLRSLVRYQCEHTKINCISPRTHVLFSIYHFHHHYYYKFLVTCPDQIQLQYYYSILIPIQFCSYPCWISTIACDQCMTESWHDLQPVLTSA